MSSSIKLSVKPKGLFWEIPVLFEDADYLALDKPPGLPVASNPEHPERICLTDLLHAGIKDGKPWAVERGLDFLMHTHRLDAEASGVLLLARSRAMVSKTASVFGSELPSWRYLAIVNRPPDDDEFTVDAAIATRPAPNGFYRVDPQRGKKAKTRFKVLERFSRHALVECLPLTDRVHQVRAHLRFRGAPIAGDPLYSGKPLFLSSLKPEYHLKPNRTERPLTPLPALHCEAVRLIHPRTGQSLEITTPPAKDFEVALRYLRRHSSPTSFTPESPS